MLVTVQVFCQKPFKGSDSTKLINNVLYDYYGTVAVPRGQVFIPVNPPGSGLSLDENRNLITGLEPHLSDATGNTILVDNVYLTNSHNNFVSAKNVVITNSSGTSSTGADHTIINAPYADVGNDANRAGGESMFIRGFGNIGYNQSGTVLGQNNVQGSLSKTTGLISNQYYNGAIIGANVRTQGNSIYAIGENFNATEPGIHLGSKFYIMYDGRLRINGVVYQFPSTAPQVGDVLTCTAPGVLGWTQGTTAKATAVYNPYTGQYNIIKPF